MNKRKLNRVFKKIKEKCRMDFAITNADDYGDCNSCVWAAIEGDYSGDSTGIYTKVWLKGMNKGNPWKYRDEVYIGHEITSEQATKMVEIFEAEGYEINPREYDPSTCFTIKEKEGK